MSIQVDNDKASHRPLLDKNGRIDVIRLGIEKSHLSDLYYSVLSASWTKFFVSFVLAYLTLNLTFGALYFLGGDCIRNADPNLYWDSFIFAVQTSSTIGYGYMSPSTPYANLIVVFNSIVSLLLVAITTGIAFARFARPSARIVFSKNAILNQFEGKRRFGFRVGNIRMNQIVDARIHVVLLKYMVTEEGIHFRKLVDLELVRNRSPMFALTWSVIHTIDEDSPFHGMSLEDIRNDRSEILVNFTGLDDVFLQTVHAKHIYYPQEIVEAKRFEDMVMVRDDGKRVIDYSKIHDYVAS